MSTAAKVRKRVLRMPLAKPFTTAQFLKLGSRTAVDKALARLVREGVLQRILRGVFMRPKHNRYVGWVSPGADEVVKVIAKARGYTIDRQGANAVLNFMLSTQVPALPVFYTSGPTREFRIGKLPVLMKHVNPRKLQLAGTHPGMALNALWYLGKKCVDDKVVDRIREELSEEDFETLQRADIPAWMAKALERGGGKEPSRA